MAYWTLLESGPDKGMLRVHDKPPKKVHVIESQVRVDEQTIDHTFTHSITGASRQFRSHHGYDRSVKRHNIIKEMLA